MTIRDVPLQKEIAHILFDERKCKEWLVEIGIIWKARDCETCGKRVMLNVETEKYRHYCTEGRKEYSMWKNTFFSKSKVKPNDAMNMIYLWLCGGTHSMLRLIGGHSTHYVTNLLADLNQLLADNLNQSEMIIGGDDVVVELMNASLAKGNIIVAIELKEYGLLVV